MPSGGRCCTSLDWDNLMKRGRPKTESTLPAGLASPARRALAAAGISRLEQFAEFSELDLLGLHGMGPRAIDTIRRAMAKHGIRFAVITAGAQSASEAANRRIRRRPVTR